MPDDLSDYLQELLPIVPPSLQRRMLEIAHYAKSAFHPGGMHMFTLQRYLYWPSMALDVFGQVRNSEACARECIKLHKHKSLLKLFAATIPFEQTAIDIFGPLPRTRAGHQ